MKLFEILVRVAPAKAQPEIVLGGIFGDDQGGIFGPPLKEPPIVGPEIKGQSITCDHGACVESMFLEDRSDQSSGWFLSGEIDLCPAHASLHVRRPEYHRELERSLLGLDQQDGERGHGQAPMDPNLATSLAQELDLAEAAAGMGELFPSKEWRNLDNIRVVDQPGPGAGVTTTAVPDALDRVRKVDLTWFWALAALMLLLFGLMGLWLALRSVQGERDDARRSLKAFQAMSFESHAGIRRLDCKGYGVSERLRCTGAMVRRDQPDVPVVYGCDSDGCEFLIK